MNGQRKTEERNIKTKRKGKKQQQQQQLKTAGKNKQTKNRK